jgi:hypothetical protein
MKNRAALIAEAAERGIEVPKNATRTQIVGLLQGASNGAGREADAAPVNGFIVAKRREGDGFAVDVVPIGDATILEAVTVLSMALRAAKEQAGIT